MTPDKEDSPTRDTVLLAITGMSPAVLTETIWGLAQEQPPVIPSRVIVLTTAAGRSALNTLFEPSTQLGNAIPWDALRQRLTDQGHDLTGRLRFGRTADDIRVITSSNPENNRSVELADLRSLADNEATADFLLDQVRALVENPDTDLLVSLAGGRKTMGALLYACMTLAGRETDRLTHVLVNEPFETLRDFWFPNQPGGALLSRDGASHDPANATLQLADVPFVPLRNLFVRELGRKAGTFSRLVEECRERVRHAAGENVRLTISRSRREIDVDGTRLPLAPREHLVLLFLATRAKQDQPAFASYQLALDPLEEFRAEIVDSAPANDFSDWRHEDGIRSPFDDDQELRKAISGIRTKLRSKGGNAPLLIPCLPERGRFSLTASGPLIHIKD